VKPGLLGSGTTGSLVAIIRKLPPVALANRPVLRLPARQQIAAWSSSGKLVIASYFQRHQPGDKAQCLGRKDMIDDRDWYASHYFSTIHEPVGVDHIIVCFHQPPGMSGDFDGLVLSRLKGKKQEFTKRQQKIIEEAHILLAPHVGGQLARFQDPSPWGLPPRCRQVLSCLLEGDSDKQIAKRLSISHFTVNHYTKLIFHHFHVQSRMELLALWIRRLHRKPFPWTSETGRSNTVSQ
jgi:DNA-binding CsgD family transcriptional regulator